MTATLQQKNIAVLMKNILILIIDGMNNVVNGIDGTANNCKIPDYEICGKTGTAQNPHGESHSIFIAFSPKENPKLLLLFMLKMEELVLLGRHLLHP